MKLNELIGQRIKDILIWIRSIDGEVSETQLYIQLDNSNYLEFPIHFSKENTQLNVDITKKVVSLFTEISYYPICFINSEGKTIKRLKRSKSTFNFFRFLNSFRIFNFLEKDKLLNFKEKKQLLKLKNQLIVSLHLFQLENKKESLVIEFANGNCLSFSSSTNSELLNFYGIQLFEDIFQVQKTKGDMYQTVEKQIESLPNFSTASIARS